MLGVVLITLGVLIGAFVALILSACCSGIGGAVVASGGGPFLIGSGFFWAGHIMARNFPAGLKIFGTLTMISGILLGTFGSFIDASNAMILLLGVVPGVIGAAAFWRGHVMARGYSEGKREP